MSLNPNQRIVDVLQAIHQGHYRIPNIQRGYEWNQERVLKLLDSIMSGYPIGAIMVWRPTVEILQDILTRPFVRDYDAGQDYVSHQPHEADDSEAYLVLDGQQRLQSLYLSFYGSYNVKRVYLQLDYVPTDVDEDTDYRFEFLTKEEADTQPEMVHLVEIANLDSDTKFEFIEKLASKLSQHLTDPDEQKKMFEAKRLNIGKNIDRFVDRFNMRTSLLFQEVEKRHNYDHVLEIFERVNSGGMVLTKSALLFSTLKLKLQQMEGKFTESLNFLNHGDRYNFDTDFLIKTCLVVFDQRAKYEVVKLKNDGFIHTLETRWTILDKCTRQMSTWLDETALIKCDRFLRSRLALIPILDYMMLSGNHNKPDGVNAAAMTEYLYMAFFRRLFSRGPDNVLDQIHNILVAQVKLNPSVFPIDALRNYMEERQNIAYRLERHFFENDVDLILNIVDGGVLQIDPTDKNRHPKDLKLEVDHIFPRKSMPNIGANGDHLGNYRLIVMPANRRKSGQMPDTATAFFGDKDSALKEAYETALQQWTKENFDAFRDLRSKHIRERVGQFFGLSIPDP